jgi:hypothetical protein
VATALTLSITAASFASTYTAPTVTLNTSSLTNTTGYLDFIFNPDTTGGTYNQGTVSVTSPSLPTFSIQNTGAFNDWSTAYTFTNTFQFTPTFSTTLVPGADTGSTFALAIYDANGNLITTNDSSGEDLAVVFSEDKSGAVSPAQVYAPFKQPAPVPEASTDVVSAIFILMVVAVLTYRSRATRTQSRVARRSASPLPQLATEPIAAEI